VFLGITVAVYSTVRKLLNPYTRLMRHFATSMMIAFLVLAVNQEPIL
jgi:hypothetical protein